MRGRPERIATALRPWQEEKAARGSFPPTRTVPSDAGPPRHHAGYNRQIVVDEPHGLIVPADVVSDPNNRPQFAPQIAAAAETIKGKTPAVAGADNGYYRGEELEPMTAVATQVLVPARRQPETAPRQPFAKGRFT